ncbi:MAG: sugar transferase [Opitutales bacterium]
MAASRNPLPHSPYRTFSAPEIRRWNRRARRKSLQWRSALALAGGLKRGIDIVGAVVGIIVFGPFMVVIALLIRWEDGPPVLFRQVRVGAQGRPFQILKFRSMVKDAEALRRNLEVANKHPGGVTFKVKADPRITRVGKWIRKMSLDETPQFFNVLRGDMALVGPRPPLPAEVTAYKSVHLRRLRIKPGITCLWQIGGRANIDFDEQVRLDLRYIQSESIWQDLRILFLTIPAVILGRGAY